MKDRLFRHFVSAGSILDLGSNQKPSMKRVQVLYRKNIGHILPMDDGHSAAMDWQAIGSDLYKAADRVQKNISLETNQDRVVYE